MAKKPLFSVDTAKKGVPFNVMDIADGNNFDRSRAQYEFLVKQYKKYLEKADLKDLERERVRAQLDACENRIMLLDRAGTVDEPEPVEVEE